MRLAPRAIARPLTKVPGIGKKTAERLVVELKDKLAVLAKAAGPARAAPGAGALEQLRTALVNLGYRPPREPTPPWTPCATAPRGGGSTSSCARR